MYAFFLLVFLLIARSRICFNVNVKILVCQIIGPPATGSAGLVPTPAVVVR